MTDAIDYLEGYLKGKADGRKEVVDWLETYDGSYIDERFFKSKFYKTKLKEWGME